MSFLSLTHCISGRKIFTFIKLSQWDNFSFLGWVSWHKKYTTSFIVFFAGAGHKAAEEPPVWSLSSAALDLSKKKNKAEKEVAFAEAIKMTAIHCPSFCANWFQNKRNQELLLLRWNLYLYVWNLISLRGKYLQFFKTQPRCQHAFYFFL